MTPEEEQDLLILEILIKNRTREDAEERLEAVLGAGTHAILVNLQNRGYANAIGARITTAGEIWFNLLQAKKQKEKAGSAPSKKTIIYDIVKIVLAALLGFIIRVATEPKDTQLSNQNKHSQDLPKKIDTVRKK
jgi:hypothetical protein